MRKIGQQGVRHLVLHYPCYIVPLIPPIIMKKPMAKERACLFLSLMVVAGAVFLPAFPRQGLSETATAPAAPTAKTDTKIETSAPEKKESLPALRTLVSKETLETTANQLEAAPETTVGQEPVGELVTAERAVAMEEKVPEKKMVTKTISGEVGAKGPSGIALVYEKNEKEKSSKEMWFPFEAKLEFSGYKNTKDIDEGDEVKVTYEEAEDGSERVLTGVTLQKKRPKEEEPSDEEESDE